MPIFNRILIANRGEIACRIIDTARRMGVETVAVYSDADASARHVRMADQAVRVGPAPASESYLRGDAIIEAAKDTGATAIHPGYGFLSENPDFVEAVEAAGLTFIGPSAKAIRAMGLKDAAKALMEQAGVPVVPGYHGTGQEDDLLAAEAAKIGYPVLIKAVAGGGGKGMRRVDAPGDFAEALASARAEAVRAFGNDAVLIEKYVDKPRHIEVQVFGDGKRAIHLFERDCSLQRRHQKVIEEAPAPGMTPEVRAAMGAAAVRAAEAIGYAGAGTVEFIVDGTGPLRADGFWFMEMNTRLQVEHPVTEAITGVDLVEWQLRVAAGEPLPAAQKELVINGHAFEARLYAEDAPAGLLPATGRLDHLAFPAGVRIDTGVDTGDTITPHYDPMIAKITTQGPDRAQALNALADALAATEVAGLTTNLHFLENLARHPRIADGDVDTGLIADDLDALSEPPLPPCAALALAALTFSGDEVDDLRGFALWGGAEARVDVACGAHASSVCLTFPTAATALAEVGGQQFEAVLTSDGWALGAARAVQTTRDRVRVTGLGCWDVELRDPLAVGAAEFGDIDVILAPMPGLVRSVHAKAGDTVVAGERLLVLEAMKMEHALRASRDGVLAEMNCAEGDQVEAGVVLARMAPESPT